jgi:hypothetical protein
MEASDSDRSFHKLVGRRPAGIIRSAAPSWGGPLTQPRGVKVLRQSVSNKEAYNAGHKRLERCHVETPSVQCF